MDGKWYDPGTIGSKRRLFDEQQIQAPPDIPATDGVGGGVGLEGGIDTVSSQSSGKAPDISKELQGKIGSDESKSKTEKHDAPKNQRRRMQFMQYMRQENADDRALVKEFGESIKTKSDWKREDHLNDMRPSIWFRKDQHVVEVYAVLGNLAAVFGIIPPINENDKQNYTMMKIVFPPVRIPHMIEDEDTGEETEDFEEATKTFKTFIEECDDYIKEQNQSREVTPNKRSWAVKRPVDKGEEQ